MPVKHCSSWSICASTRAASTARSAWFSGLAYCGKTAMVSFMRSSALRRTSSPSFFAGLPCTVRGLPESLLRLRVLLRQCLRISALHLDAQAARSGAYILFAAKQHRRQQDQNGDGIPVALHSKTTCTFRFFRPPVLGGLFLYHNAAFLIAKVSQYLCPPHPAPGKVGIQPGFIAPQLGQIFGVNFLVYQQRQQRAVVRHFLARR